jgi:hypothetical protein
MEPRFRCEKAISCKVQQWLLQISQTKLGRLVWLLLTACADERFGETVTRQPMMRACRGAEDGPKVGLASKIFGGGNDNETHV